MTIEFVIRGNHKNPVGNAMPKIKLTKRQQWTDRAQAYKAWKKHVVDQLLFASVDQHGKLRNELVGVIDPLAEVKPFCLQDRKKATMQILIQWKDWAHADCENVFGSIADALFQNDKYLTGSFDYIEPRGDGKVYVRIIL